MKRWIQLCLSRLKRQFILVIGWLLIVLGLITLPLPIPLGMPLLVISAVLLLSYSVWVKRRYIHLRRQAHRGGGWMSAFLARFERSLRYKKFKRMHARKLRQSKLFFPLG